MLISQRNYSNSYNINANITYSGFLFNALSFCNATISPKPVHQFREKERTNLFLLGYFLEKVLQFHSFNPRLGRMWRTRRRKWKIRSKTALSVDFSGLFKSTLYSKWARKIIKSCIFGIIFLSDPSDSAHSRVNKEQKLLYF